MAAQKDDATARHGKVRKTPAVIQQRHEPDPADVIVAGVATTTPADDGDMSSDASSRQTTPDTTTSTGDSDTRQRHPERHDDMTRDSDMTTQRQTTPADVATDDTGDSDSDSDTGATTTGEGISDMTPAATATATQPPAGRHRPPARPEGEDEPEPESMKSASFSLPPSLIQRLRAAQHHTQLKPDGYANLSELVRSSIEQTVGYLEATYNRGRPFPRVEKLRTGPSATGAVRGAQVRARNRQRSAQAPQPAQGEQAPGRGQTKADKKREGGSE
jgi:hypothetical protein